MRVPAIRSTSSFASSPRSRSPATPMPARSSGLRRRAAHCGSPWRPWGRTLTASPSDQSRPGASSRVRADRSALAGWRTAGSWPRRARRKRGGWPPRRWWASNGLPRSSPWRRLTSRPGAWARERSNAIGHHGARARRRRGAGDTRATGGEAAAGAAPAGSLRPADIVEVQHAVPMALVQPLALALWLPAVLAVCFLAPFDLPQADGELQGGVFSEYRGLDAALVGLAQRVLLLAVSGMTAALFLSGWQGPLLPAALWMALKTTAVAALLLWVGRRVPRLEIDRVTSLAWKVANPLAIVAIVIAGLITLLFYR